MRKISFIFIVLILFLFVYSVFVEPSRLVVTNYRVQDKELSGIKIVLLGDLHVKFYQEKFLKKVVDKVNDIEPDLVLIVGDYITGHQANLGLGIEKIAEYLRQIDVKSDIVSVLGNHDWWYGGEKVEKALEDVGIKVLKNSNVKLKVKGKSLYIAGVEDLYTREPDIKEALKNTKNPRILLTHNPDVFVDVPSNVNLTLAGHTHGGQIRFPFVGALVVPSDYGSRFAYGVVEERNRKLIVTGGIGTSVLPIRFFCTPEIVVIEFE